jgi:hypothetical protein
MKINEIITESSKADIKDQISSVQDKIEAIVKDGGKVGLNDPLSKQLKSLQAKLKTVNESQENSQDQLYDVTIIHNYYAGRYYNSGGRLYTVSASSPEEAEQIVKQYKPEIEADLREKFVRSGTRRTRLISKSDKYNYKDRDVHGAKLSTRFGANGSIRAIDRNGVFIQQPNNVTESQVNELDNGPNGTYSDNINYGAGRSTQTNFTKTAGQKAALPPRKEPAPKLRADRPLRQPKPKAEPVYTQRKPRFKSAEPRNELEQRAKAAMYDVWQRIGGDVPDLQDPYEIAEVCTDANRLQLVLDMSPEEEREILDLGQTSLARLASNFGY